MYIKRLYLLIGCLHLLLLSYNASSMQMPASIQSNGPVLEEINSGNSTKNWDDSESFVTQGIVLHLRQAPEVSLTVLSRINDTIINSAAHGILFLESFKNTAGQDSGSSDKNPTLVPAIAMQVRAVQEYLKHFPEDKNALRLSNAQMATKFLCHLLNKTIQEQKCQKIELLELSKELEWVKSALKRKTCYLTAITLWLIIRWKLEKRPFTRFNCINFGVTLLSNFKDYSGLSWYDLTLLPLEWYYVKIIERMRALKIAKIEADLCAIRALQGELSAAQLLALFEKYR